MSASLLTALRFALKQLGLQKTASQSLSAIPLWQRLKVAMAAFVALFVVTITSQTLASPTATIILLASMGASSVLLFGLPNSPLAKPWSFVGGHVISAGIGLLCSHLFTDLALMAAVTIGCVLFVMYVFECMHPPGGATALVPVIASTEQVLGYDFLVFPVLLNVMVMLLVSMVLNRFLVKPTAATKANAPTLPKQQSPLQRLGLQPTDLLSALNSFQTVVDVSEHDLEEIYRRAQLHAYQRKAGDIRCRDIMTNEPIAISADMSVAAAWRLLQKHQLRVLPVVDKRQHLLGIVTVSDFLKELKVPHYWGLLRHLNHLLLKRGHKKQQQQCISELMTVHPIAVAEHDHLTTVIPLLSEQGIHYIPVLNQQQQLTGIITQSDLIAALCNVNQS